MSAAHGRRYGKDRRTLFRQLRNRRRTADVQGNNGATERNRGGITNRAQPPHRVIPNRMRDLTIGVRSTQFSKCDHSSFVRSFAPLRMTIGTTEPPKETAGM